MSVGDLGQERILSLLSLGKEVAMVLKWEGSGK